MIRHSRSAPNVSFVDAIGASVSLGLVRDIAVRDLRARTRLIELSTEDGWLSRMIAATRGATSPVLVLFVAHHLGRAAHRFPPLLWRRPRVLFLGWEIEQLTTSLKAELNGADVILGISQFNSDVFRRYFPDTPVVAVPICPALPDPMPSSRDSFGLADDPFVVVSVFDPISGMDRKNPLGVIDAFTRAFPGRTDVRLVFKTHGGFHRSPNEAERQRGEEFLQSCARDSRIILIDEYWPYQRILALIASSDAFISLARAEGLGLPVLEAMSMGVPTICTAYSGFLDFVTKTSALLVPYDLVDITDSASDYYHPSEYDEQPRWAQPDLDAAAAYLRRLANDPELREMVGTQGRERAREFAAECVARKWVDEVMEALESPQVNAHHADRQRAFLRAIVPSAKQWREHEQEVRRARFMLRVRTVIGRIKRQLTSRSGALPE